MLNVVCGALFRVRQHSVSVGEDSENLLISSFLIVGMESLRQNPVDPVDRIVISILADLEGFVVIHEEIRFHHYTYNRPSCTPGYSESTLIR